MKTALLLGLLMTSVAGAQSLRGLMIVAADGTFLGTCEGTVGTYSISNPFSQYGSEYGLYSMFNPYSLYGGVYSMYSPYNPYTTTAPYLIGYTPELYAMFTNFSYRPTPALRSALSSLSTPRLTVNTYIINAVDPDALRAACRNP